MCIQEEIKNNAININQIQPIQSELIQKSSSCSSNDGNDFTPNAIPDNQPSTEVPIVTTISPEKEDDIPEISSSSVPEVATSINPQTVTAEITTPTTVSSIEPDSGSTDEDNSQS